MSQNNKPDWILIYITTITIAALAGLVISDFLTYLSKKETNELIRTTITNNGSVEHIQGFLNSKP